MQVLSVRCGLTKNLGNYESAKLEIEAAPSDGQPADQLLAEVNEYLQKQVEAAISAAGGVKEKPVKGSKKASEAPLKAVHETAEGECVQLKDDAPFDADSAPNSEPGEKPAKKSTGKKSTKAESQAAMGDGLKAAKKELQYALDSETLDELLERFNSVRKVASAFGDAWEFAVTKVVERYRKLNSLDANPETCDVLVKAFKSERQAIENAKAKSAAA